MGENTLKKITFYRVWKNTKPFITIPGKKLSETVAYKIGFAWLEKKKMPEQWYKIAPKREDSWVKLKKALKRQGYIARIKEADTSKTEELGWNLFNGYEFGMKKNAQAKKISTELIAKEPKHSHLAGVSIGHFFKSQAAPFDEETGLMTFAYATTASVMNEKFAKYDFLIYYYEEAWDIAVNSVREVLVDHELSHCGMDGTPYIKGHDIEEFKYIINKYGLKPPAYHWAGKTIKKVLETREILAEGSES